jgi:hypothetical protein
LTKALAFRTLVVVVINRLGKLMGDGVPPTRRLTAMRERLNDSLAAANPTPFPLLAERRKSGTDAKWDDPDELVEDELDDVDEVDDFEDEDDDDLEDEDEFDDEEIEVADFEETTSLDELEDEETDEDDDWDS